MNNLARNKAIVGVAILLIAINLALLGTIGIRYYYRNVPPTVDENRPARAQEMMSRQLGFSAEQQEQFRSLRRSHSEDTRALRAEIRDTQKMIADELAAEAPNRNLLDSLSLRIGQLNTLQQQVTIEHFMEVRKVCSPEQQIHLQRMLRRMMAPDTGMRQRGKGRPNRQQNYKNTFTN